MKEGLFIRNNGFQIRRRNGRITAVKLKDKDMFTITMERYHEINLEDTISGTPMLVNCRIEKGRKSTIQFNMSQDGLRLLSDAYALFDDMKNVVKEGTEYHYRLTDAR